MNYVKWIVDYKQRLLSSLCGGGVKRRDIERQWCTYVQRWLKETTLIFFKKRESFHKNKSISDFQSCYFHFDNWKK